jgi:hypothetical protein
MVRDCKNTTKAKQTQKNEQKKEGRRGGEEKRKEQYLNKIINVSRPCGEVTTSSCCNPPT